MRIKSLGYMISLLCLSLPTLTLAGGVNHAVQVSSFTFTPQTLTIGVGDSVTFTNAGGFHNVVSDAGVVTPFRCANGCDGAGGNGAASSSLWSATVTFPTAGTIGYFCEIHGAAGSGMFGTIVVNTPVSLQSFEVD